MRRKETTNLPASDMSENAIRNRNRIAELSIHGGWKIFSKNNDIEIFIKPHSNELDLLITNDRIGKKNVKMVVKS
jgi:hypothetical protein